MPQIPAIDKSKTTPKNAIEFDKSYRVMDVRLLRGWSAYELSWLLGYRDWYVRDVENPLHGLQYAPEDTNYLRLIFECGYDAIIAAKLEPPIWNISVDSSTNETGLSVHRVYLSPLSRKKKKPAYTVVEEPKRMVYSSESSANEIQLEGYVRKLMAADYFGTPKTRLEVFSKCKEKFGEPLKPLILIDAIGNITRSHSRPKLTKGPHTDMARATLVLLK